MPLSEILSNAARAEAERIRRLDAEAKSLADKTQRKKLWEAFNAASDFLPRGPADLAARSWTALLMAACDQLKAAGEVGRLEAMRYSGSDRLRLAGTEAAFQVCRLGCAGATEQVKAALQTLIESGPDLDSPFRLFLEAVRDNRQLWAATERPPSRH